jgi:hypothetical protein
MKSINVLTSGPFMDAEGVYIFPKNSSVKKTSTSSIRRI